MFHVEGDAEDILLYTLFVLVYFRQTQGKLCDGELSTGHTRLTGHDSGPI